MYVNPKLAEIFMLGLFPHFFRHKVDEIQLNPWWWPRGPGRCKEDWGLPDSADREYASLMGRAGAKVGWYDYKGFLGSVRAKPGCPILLSIRPSNGTMQGSFSTPHSKLPKTKDGRLWPVHLSDLYKIRSRCHEHPFKNMNDAGWRLSVECLASEFEYLEAISNGGKLEAAQLMIVRDYIPKCFASHGPLCKTGALRAHWRESAADSRLEQAIALVEAALDIKDHQLPFWSQPGFKGAFEKAIESTPKHDVEQYAEDA